MKIFVFFGIYFFIFETQGFLFGGSSCGCAPPPPCPPPAPCCRARAKAAKTEVQKPLDDLELRAKLAGFNLDDPSVASEVSETQLKYLENLGEENNDFPVETQDLDEKKFLKIKESKSVRFAPQKVDTESAPEPVRVDQSTAAPEIVSAEETAAKDSEQKCNNEELRKLIIDNITENSTESKHAVNKAAEAEFGGSIDVICSRGHFSYIYSSNLFCEAARGEVTCIAFRQSL